ncbi:MAG: hypothetical protein Ta2G_03100 [Termitinemataceae bacterium]|nr:MAG: hypothetical protein Ta2G_03100 [Termitinemataceae bacterium]
MKKILLLVCVCVFMVSCASEPYTVKSKMAIGDLKGTVVFPDITVMPMSLQVLPLIDAGIYNGNLKKHDDARNAVVSKSVVHLRKELSDRFAENFSVKAVLADKKFDTVLFDKNDNLLPDVEQQIIKQCQDSKADYIVLLRSQILQTGVMAFGASAFYSFSVSAFIFDKTGKKLSQGAVRTELSKINASDSDGFGMMIEMTRPKILSLFNKMIIAPPPVK